MVAHLQPATSELFVVPDTMSTLSTKPTTADGPFRDRLNSTTERLMDQLETSSLDNRSYRVIKLKNQLEALLVHDAETDKASAAMDVNVGNFSDPEDMPGLAHCVEHMLSMGSRKAGIYPIDVLSRS